jgi:hypothetical protein
MYYYVVYYLNLMQLHHVETLAGLVWQLML